jgi:signal peptidase I
MRRHVGLLAQAIELLVLTVVAYLLIQTFIAQPFRVEQGSMESTLQQGQYILIDKITPRFGGYEPGDIVVFRPPPGATDEDGTPFVKRVIGEPGDLVEIHDGLVWIDGIALDESAYVFDGEPTIAAGRAQAVWVVPEDSLFVLGDHRSNSTDSRAERIGMVPIDDVIGRAVLRYWPVPEMAVLETPAYPQLSGGRGDVVGLSGGRP